MERLRARLLKQLTERAVTEGDTLYDAACAKSLLGSTAPQPSGSPKDLKKNNPTDPKPKNIKTKDEQPNNETKPKPKRHDEDRELEPKRHKKDEESPKGHSGFFDSSHNDGQSVAGGSDDCLHSDE